MKYGRYNCIRTYNHWCTYRRFITFCYGQGDEKKEIGILLAVGRSKVEIVGQFLTENILITFLSIIVSAGLSITFADKIGAYIIQKAGESATDLTISIATSDMVMVYSIGLALVCFSVLIASYTVIRLNPKDILSKMD